jgi:hypothetical protein
MSKQIDNSALTTKVALRKKWTPEPANVLDLFCGGGEMYKRCYKGVAAAYHGVDNTKIHAADICTLQDNKQYVKTHDIDQYNVFDLDDYASPWSLMYTIIGKLHSQQTVHMFLTDGLPLHLQRNGNMTKWMLAAEKQNKRINIPGLYRWYADVFGTMLLDIRSRYGWDTRKAIQANNPAGTVYYWYLQLERRKT